MGTSRSRAMEQALQSAMPPSQHSPLRSRKRGEESAALLRQDDSDPHLPLHEQIYRRLRTLIASGEFPKGARLPSSRAIASALQISRNPVLAALERLQADAWINTQRGSGTVVTYSGDISPSENQNPSTNAPRSERPFAIGFAAADLFPRKSWIRLQSKCWRQIGHSQLQDMPAAGWPALRKAVARFITAKRHLRCEAEQVFITTNTRAALELAIRAIGLRDAPMWVEDPGYFARPERLQYIDADVVTVPADSDGLRVEDGRARAPNARAALVVPTCHFPTCVAMTESRRRELRMWATDASAWILEDDHGWHSYFNAMAPAPIATEYPRTVLIGSFNELIFNGLRVAYVVSPPGLIDRFEALHSGLEGQANGPNQMVLGEFISSGRLDDHLRILAAAFAERRQALVSALKDHLDGIVIPKPQMAGLHLVCEVNSMSAGDLAAHAAARKINMLPLSRYCLHTSREREILLGYSAFQPEAIHDAVIALAASLT